MVVKDGQKWRRVNSRKIRGQWYSLEGDEELNNMPDIFITIDGKVPKNISGEGDDIFSLYPVRHYGRYRYSGMTYYDYNNSYGYYYASKEYTYWDGILHSRTQYYHTDSAIEWLEDELKCKGENLEAHLNGVKDEDLPRMNYGYPFFVANDERFVKARYTFKKPKKA
jgi:hypothetical protein